MNSKLRVAALAALLIGAPLVAWGAGNWSNWPVVGGNSYCSSYNGNSSATGGTTGQGAGNPICAQTVPAGPVDQSGAFLPADVYGNNGATPINSALIPVSAVGYDSRKNWLMGGDFATNLWQRGTTPLSAASPSSATMSADRWYAYDATGEVTIAKETGSTDSIPSVGLYASMRIQRPNTTTDTGAVCVGQVLDKEQAQLFLGNNAVLSWYGYAGSGFSAASDNLTVTVAYYTAADSVTPGTNTGTFASGTIAGYQAAVGGTSNGTTGSIASGVATVPISTTWTRYAVYAPIPSTNSSGTAVTGIGVSFCYTPVGTAGASDYWELEGVQLQSLSGVATVLLPNGVISPTGFERVFPVDEAKRELSYSYVFNDAGTAGDGIFGTGWDVSTAAADVTIPFPVPMREAPAATVATATSFAVFELNGTTVQACTTLAAVSNSKLTTSQAALTCTTGGTSLTANAGTQLTSDATGAANTVTFSAEP